MNVYVFGLYSCIRTYSVRIQENTDQKQLRIWTLFTQNRIQDCQISPSRQLHVQSLQLEQVNAGWAMEIFAKIVDGLQQ